MSLSTHVTHMLPMSTYVALRNAVDIEQFSTMRNDIFKDYAQSARLKVLNKAGTVSEFCDSSL